MKWKQNPVATYTPAKLLRSICGNAIQSIQFSLFQSVFWNSTNHVGFLAPHYFTKLSVWAFPSKRFMAQKTLFKRTVWKTYFVFSSADFVTLIGPTFKTVTHCRGFGTVLINLPSMGKTGAPNDNFRKNICSEDDLRSRIFETFVVKFLACLPLLGFSNSQKMVYLPIFNGFLS